jgi:colicin import membrane protein
MNPALQPLMVPRDALRPPSADGTRVGMVLSGLAHVGLVVALALGVQWRTESPDGVEAELWAATPQLAAPPAAPATADTESAPLPAAAEQPPAPPPPPPQAQRQAEEREAEIAEEQARRERLEKARQEAEAQRQQERKALAEQKRKDERAQQLAREKAEQQAQDKARQQQSQAEQRRKEQADASLREKARQDQLRRMNAQLGGSGSPGSTGTAAREAGPSANYAGRIKARIRPHIVLIDPVAGNPQAEVELRVAPDGTILSRRLVQASGNAAWDEAVLRAVDRTAVLPRDTDGRVPASMLISFRPQE